VTGLTQMRDQLTYVEPGPAGESGGISRAYFDAIAIDGVNPCIFDDFKYRTVANDWGDSSSGDTYTQTMGGTARSTGVDNGGGWASVGSATGSGWVNHRITDNGASWAASAGFVMTMRFQTSAVPAAGNQLGEYIYLEKYSTFDPWAHIELLISSGQSWGEVRFFDSGTTGSNGVDKTDWLSNAWYKLKWERIPGGVSRIKLWLDADPEPADWRGHFSEMRTLRISRETDHPFHSNPISRFGVFDHPLREVPAR